MSNYMRRMPLKRGPPRPPDPGEMVDLRMEDASWRQGFRALSEPSTAETGEVIIWVCTEDEYREARREGRRAVGMAATIRLVEYPLTSGMITIWAPCRRSTGASGRSLTM